VRHCNLERRLLVGCEHSEQPKCDDHPPCVSNSPYAFENFETNKKLLGRSETIRIRNGLFRLKNGPPSQQSGCSFLGDRSCVYLSETLAGVEKNRASEEG